MARELTREEKRAIRALVTKWCANYDRECGCLPLDCECYMLGKCWTGALCRYFREAVLPLDPALEAALLTEGPRPEFKPCPICGGPVAPDRRQAYCSAACAKKAHRRQQRDICGKSGAGALTIRPSKPADYKAFRGRFWGRPYVSTACPCLARMLSTSRRCYSGRKSRLCDPPHDPV